MSALFTSQAGTANDRNRQPGIGQADLAAENRSVSTVLEVNVPPVPIVNWVRVFRERSHASREEQAEPRQVYLLLVDFRLCEVRVVGHVEVHTAGNAILRVQPHGVQKRVAGLARPGGSRGRRSRHTASV